MANQNNATPVSLDTDQNSFRASQTLQTGGFGVRVHKIELVAATSTTAGTVTIVDPNDNTTLFPPISVPAGSAANSIILNDNFNQALTWRDFKVTGLTATGTRLYIWYKV